MLYDFDIDKYMGKPWKRNAKGPHAYDCYGLLQAIYDDLGKDLPDVKRPELLNEMYEKCNNSVVLFKPLEKPKPYCLVGFRTKPPKVSHAGLVLPGCKTFIHCSIETGVIISNLNDEVWQTIRAGYYEY